MKNILLLMVFLSILNDNALFATGSSGNSLKDSSKREVRTSGNPFITTIYTADPSAHVWSDGRLYVYPSHDMDPAHGCDLMDRYHVYSTDDMVNWRDEGEILSASQVPWGRKEGGFMWAPDCAYKNGTYYFYYPHPSETKWNDSWKIGVLTSSKPASDFKESGYIPGVGGEFMIDPAVFVDTDGQAYFYYGGGRICQGGKLKENMIEIDGEMMNMEGIVDFHEASWVFKRNGIYYFVYSDNLHDNNQLRYAISKNPLGPWEFKGIFLGPNGCDTSHGSVVEYKGQWYLFYHNKSISNTGKGNLRSICVDKVYFNPDGTIQMVEQTSEGVSAVGKSTTSKVIGKKYEAETALFGKGAKVLSDKNASQGRCVRSYNDTTSQIMFVNVDGGKQGGRATIRIKHSGESYSKIGLVVNDLDYSFLNLLSTGSFSKYKEDAFFTVRLNPGKNNAIKLTELIGNANIDCITITLID